MTMQEPPRTSGEPSRDGARLHRRGWTLRRVRGDEPAHPRAATL